MTSTTLNVAQSFKRESVAPNPFVQIPRGFKAAIVIYFVVWRIFPLSGELADAVTEMAVTHTIAVVLQILTHCLLLYPFLCSRFAGSRIGWAHPLILPTMISIAVGVLRAPHSLLAPLTIFSPLPEFSHPLIGNWPIEQVRQAQLKANFISFLALLATYIGFSIVRFTKTPAWRLPSLRQWVLGVVFLGLLAVVFYFLQRQGGILEHMASLGGGRFRMRALVGHFLVLNKFLPYLLIFWYLFNPKIIRNPMFIAAFVVAGLLQFMVTGSRSGLFVPFAALLVAWMLINHRLPAVRSAVLGLVAFLLLGALGQVRSSGQDGRVDFSSVFEASLFENWGQTQEELAGRQSGSHLGVSAFVPNDVDHLFGRSYVAALAFWIPRTVWPEKPRGIGAHYSALIAGGAGTMEGFQGGGIPVSAPAEAYWNFSWIGVLSIFLLFGMLLRFIADYRENSPTCPIAAMALVLVVFQFSSPSTVSLVSFLQNATLLLITIMLARSSWSGR